MKLESTFSSVSALFCVRDSAITPASLLCKLVLGSSNCSICEFVASAFASFGWTLGSSLGSGICKFEKSSLTRVGSFKCARCTIQIIQFPKSFFLSISPSSASSATSVQANILSIKLSSLASGLGGSGSGLGGSGSGVGVRSGSSMTTVPVSTTSISGCNCSIMLSGMISVWRLARLSASACCACRNAHPRPRSSKTFSTESHASWQPAFLWSFLVPGSENSTLFKQLPIMAIRVQSPPKMLTSFSRVSLCNILFM
mmetsp:Transcript_56590/g.89693  ORF Transcript_56590/g.89693 Transcript_56590/m.89693 type:complete len:256 (-) Transcript_56590:189-956(-)